MNRMRTIIYCFIIFVVLSIFMFEDYTVRPPVYNEAEHETPDYHTFKGLGIKTATYPFVVIPGYETSSSSDILLLRTSQIHQNPELRNFAELGYSTVIFLCDENWRTSDFLCTSDNFESRNSQQNIPVDAEEVINIGYIENEESRYFIFPEFLITNIIRYPSLLNLTSSISNSQDIEKTIISNNLEIGKQNGISFFPGAILSVLFSYLIIIYLLNLLNDRVNIKPETIRDIIPFISLIPFFVIFFYTVDSLPYLQHGAKLTIERLTGVDPDLVSNSVWLFVPIFLLLIGFESNLLLLKYKTPVLNYSYSRLNPILVKGTIILVLSYALFLAMRNTESVMPQTVLNSLFLAFFLYILYVALSLDRKETLLRLNKYIPKNALRIVGLLILILFCTIGYSYGQSRTAAKNKIFFDPPKQYFTVPYSKLIRPYEIYHEYNVESAHEIFIGNFIVSHPDYEEIEYTYEELDNKNKSFAYLASEETESIKPLLKDQVLKTLETEEATPFFRLLTKGDIDSKVNIEITVKCSVELNSTIKLQRFRLAYNGESVITSTNALHTQRKCNLGEEYTVRLIMRVADLSTYAYSDEILKLSYTGEIVQTNIKVDDPNTKLVHLNLEQKGKYVYSPYSGSKKLEVISAKEEADNMKFIKTDNKINLGESFNLLRRRNLISHIVTIDSINKYTLIKYIK